MNQKLLKFQKSNPLLSAKQMANETPFESFQEETENQLAEEETSQENNMSLDDESLEESF